MEIDARDIQAAVVHMLIELESNRLEVVLVPSGDCSHERMSRVAVARNPEWYRALCAEFPRAGRERRKVRTIIKRRETLSALERIAIAGKDGSVYCERLWPYVVDYAKSEMVKYSAQNDSGSVFWLRCLRIGKKRVWGGFWRFAG